jgi:hypothetical protein
MANDDQAGSFVTGCLIGGIVGAVLGILLAPKPGSETRADLLAQSEDLRVRAEELAAKVRERVGPAVEGVRERMGPAMESVRERVEPVAERVSSRVRWRGAADTESDGGPGTEATSADAADSGSKADAVTHGAPR